MTMNYNFRLSFTKKKVNQVPIPEPAHYDANRYALLKNFCVEQAAAGKKMALTDFVDLYGRANGKFEVNNKQASVISLGHFGGQAGYSDASYEKQDAIYADHKDYTL